jgi:RNA polymerase sigma factor (sigma-70 family)
MTSNSAPDSQLIAACLDGNARCWDLLIARYQALIYRLARRMGLSSSDADDVFQNVCLRLYQHLGDLREPGRLASWLISTTRREVWHLRRNRVPPSLQDLAECEPDLERLVAAGQEEESLDAILVAIEERDLVRRALDQLSPDCRRLLTLLYNDDDDCSYAEVSRLLAVPIGSIGPRRARCLTRLKKIMEQIAG